MLAPSPSRYSTFPVMRALLVIGSLPPRCAPSSLCRARLGNRLVDDESVPACHTGPRAACKGHLVHATCAGKQTAIGCRPTRCAPSLTESPWHEKTSSHTLAHCENAGRTEVRLHCRRFAATGKGLHRDTCQLAGARSAKSAPGNHPENDQAQAGTCGCEPVGGAHRRQ